MQKVYAEKGETFIVIIDEYDVLIREQVGDDEFKPYLGFFNYAELKPAITLAYLTGILPIMKDMVQSKLNTFDEYNMLRIGSFAEYTGFTTEEAKSLCERYGRDFELCKSWYDGYELEGFEIYNPQAVIKACVTGKF
ncbi:MAG: AAA family ATPase, partial [Treponema sp.]|nr:AAA family ATPase [Treponema sp.]